MVGGTLYNGLNREAVPERDTFFKLQVPYLPVYNAHPYIMRTLYERVGISLVEVYERVVKSVISVCEKI